VSFLITCISLSLALKPEFRIFVRRVMKKTMSLKWWLKLWERVRGRRMRVARRTRRDRVIEGGELEKGTGTGMGSMGKVEYQE
jgi:hypothetical protein